ncbi:MAG: GNAT family N-acetyltransferase [Chloroflexi bacterium]|nr:GNAT family N-acetyltransferase [Chloroflexota bacterium]
MPDSNTQGQQFVIEALDPQKHDRAVFSCGVAALDTYLTTQASQDVKKNAARAYVLRTAESSAIIGYYTISAASVELTDLSETFARKLPRYRVLPAMLIGRLAVDQKYRGQGLGGILLANALRRCYQLSQELGSVTVMVDAKDEAAVRFYERYGFRRLTSQQMRLFMPTAEIQGL